REHRMGRLIVVDGQAELFEVVDALGAPGRLARRLDGREQQGDQYRNNCDDDQELDQGETTSSLPHRRTSLLDRVAAGSERSAPARRGPPPGTSRARAPRPPGRTPGTWGRPSSYRPDPLLNPDPLARPTRPSRPLPALSPDPSGRFLRIPIDLLF